MSRVGADAVRPRPDLHRWVEQVMGLPISLAVRNGVDLARVEEVWAQAVARLRWADAVFSPYRSDSAVARVDRGDIGLAQCPPEVADVVAIGERARVESGGAFAVWREEGGRMRFDPSGVVKGWAVQLASAHLARVPGLDFCLNAGGDLVCRVVQPDGDPWRIGVEDPADPTQLIAVISLRTGALATSAATHRGAHIRDARTGAVPVGIASVTVVADDLTRADVDATAAYALGHDGLAWLRRRAGIRGFVVDDFGRVSPFGEVAAAC